VGGTVTLYSRNRKVPNKRFPYIVEPLRNLPDGTVVDGEIVALDDDGRPVFNLLQNFTSESARIRYFCSTFSATRTAILCACRS
jgi:ATP-dependent DNA ligase